MASCKGAPRPVPTLKFQISDIDWSNAGTDCLTGVANEGWRRDQVVNTATAIGTAFGGSQSGTASSGDDLGTVKVDFGASLVTEVTITYNEAAYDQNCDPSFHPGCVFDGTNWKNKNPGYRGIGLFGLTMFPVTLTEFTIE